MNDGVIAPDLSAGTITFVGAYEQSASGLLNIELGGLGAGEFDVLAIVGNVPHQKRKNFVRGVVETGEKAIESFRMAIESSKRRHRMQKIGRHPPGIQNRHQEVSANDPSSIRAAEPIH